MDIDLDFEHLHHRNVLQNVYGNVQRNVYSETESDSTGSDDDDDDDVGMRHISRMQEEEEEEEEIMVDPGPFLYHKRICAAAMPCFLLVIGFVGETILTIMTVGTVLLVLLDRMGEKRRSVMVYAILFIPCHVLVFVAVLPLLWLSWWNFFLIGAINMYVILTGGWIILMFPAFRTEEPELSLVVEQMLFSAYPAVCSALITWVLTTITPLSTAPLILMAISFVFLQVFLTPAVSSFKGKVVPDDDQHILQQSTVMVMTLSFCLAPSVLHVLLFSAATSTDALLSQKSLLQLIFTLSLSLFLATLLSVRQLFEYTGLPYKMVIRGRWACGMSATLLCYPVLQQFRLLSHFLPWLPVAIVTFATLGLLLGHRKYWVPSIVLFIGLCSILGFWMSVLPWRLTFYLLQTIHLNLFYVLLCANFGTCLLCMYVASYGNKNLLSFLVCIQSLLLTVCETSLYNSNLYSLSLCVVTTVMAAYMLQRLQFADKMRLGAVLFSSSVHITKGVSCLLAGLLLRERLGTVAHVTLFLLSFAVLQSFVYAPREAVTLDEAVRNLVFLLVSLAANTFPVLTTLCYNLWQDAPTSSDLIGIWFLVGGLLVMLFAQVHSEVVPQIRLSGVLMVITGVTILSLQPQFDLSLYAVFQWCEIASLLLLLAVLMTGVGMSVRQVVIMAAITALCPGARTVLMLYEEVPSAVHFVLYMTASASVITMTMLYNKAEIMLQLTDTTVIASCILSAVSLVLALILDLALGNIEVTLMSLPALKGMLVTAVSLSILMKLLAVKKVPGNIPVATLDSDDKSKPKLPLVANFVTVSAFLLVCLQGPTKGFLHDMWSCAGSLIFFCLHRDQMVLGSLRDQNNRTPTILASVTILCLASIARSCLWHVTLYNVIWGMFESLAIVLSLPVYLVLWGILWRNEIISENLVVFCMPLNGVLFLIGTSYTVWALGVCGLLAGTWMMTYKLPMVPYAISS